MDGCDHHYEMKNGIPHGTSEVFGKEMDQRRYVIALIEEVYRKFGFDPLNTPILEHANVFKGHHGEGEELLFHLVDRIEEDLVLRYDLTVSLARYMSDHPESPVPFKRYQIAPVFRDDETDRGHFREFTQCDGDVIGVSDLTADAEVIHMAYEGLTKLGFTEFKININHRKIINGIAQKIGLTNKDGQLKLQRALDEVSKFAEKWEYHNCSDHHDDFIHHIDEILRKRGLTESAISMIISIFMIPGNLEQKLDGLSIFLYDNHEAITGISELQEIISYTSDQVREKINFDLTLARGADYYTGFILEGSLPNIPIGAVLGGGRYDDLVKNLGGPDLPAVGMAFGLERIIVAMQQLGLNSFKKSPRILVVSQHEDEKKVLLDYTRKLRMEGNYTDFLSIFDRNKEEIYAYAKKRGFDSIIVIVDEQIKTWKMDIGI